MNARICQLCGKPLSRFNVGSGGDFCSREHRNQYRLRLGMDRLMEANKVTSLMRRRENAKQISAAFLIADYQILPRSCPPTRPRHSGPFLEAMRPTAARLPVLGIAAHSDRADRLGAVRAAGAPQKRALLVAMGSPGKVVALPLRNRELPIRIPQSRQSILRLPLVDPKARTREFGILRHPALRVHIASLDRKRSKPSAAGPQSLNASPRPYLLRSRAAKGRTLRVSTSAGFRLPEPARPTVALAPPVPMRLSACWWAREMAPAAKRLEASRRSAGPRKTRLDPLYRAPVMATSGAAFLWPSVMNLAASEARGAEAAARCATVAWNCAEPLAPEFHIRQEGAGIGRNAAPGIAFLPGFVSVQSAQRVTAVQFAPQSNPFDYTARQLRGSLPGRLPFGVSPAGRPKPNAPPAPPAAAIEEHFANGWSNWLGGMEDWKLDIAGVRTGSLALFAPSMGLADYDFEFLARIEHLAINWVYRAQDLTTYVQASLAVAADGGYTFTRAAVSGETAERAVVHSIRPVKKVEPSPGGRTAVTVRMRFRGGDVKLFLDGQDAGSWSEKRFPAGGIGFHGPPGDRARLYWIRLTPAGMPAKENWKQ